LSCAIQVRERVNETIEASQTADPQSPVIHGDETDATRRPERLHLAIMQPGAQGTCYYEYDHSRGQAVADRLLKGVA